MNLVFTIASSWMQTTLNRRRFELEAKESGMAYSVINGMEKTKLTGSEKRLFSRWLNLYSNSMEITYNPPRFLKLNSVISKTIMLF